MYVWMQYSRHTSFAIDWLHNSKIHIPNADKLIKRDYKVIKLKKDKLVTYIANMEALHYQTFKDKLISSFVLALLCIYVNLDI